MLYGQLARLAATVVVTAGAFAALPPAAGADHTYGLGDVFISVGDGEVEWWVREGANAYAYHQTLQGEYSVITAGSKFDKFGNFYVAGFDNQSISRFNDAGVFTGVFATGDPAGFVESLSITRATDDTGTHFAVYAGQSGGFADVIDPQNDVLKYSEAGVLVDRYDVEVERRGSDEIDLATDLCTLYYTSEGSRVLRYDVCRRLQLPDFTDQGLELYALRIRPGGEVIAADMLEIKRFNQDGTVAQVYDKPLNECWFGLNLDPDNTSFWSADFCTNETVKFDIATGAVLAVITPQKPSCNLADFFDNCVFGVSVYGEKTASGGGVQPGEDPVCSASITGGGWGHALTGKATFGGNAKIGKDGFAQGELEYQDHGISLNFHSITVGTVGCDGNHAEIVGNGRVKNNAVFDTLSALLDFPVLFRLELEDNGTQGQSLTPDTYHLTLTGGVVYDSGKFPLLGGNVAIHRKK